MAKESRGHLIKELAGELHEVRSKLEFHYSHMANCARHKLITFTPSDSEDWIFELKQLEVEVTLPEPRTERLVELVNQLPTIRRLIDFLKWAEQSNSGLKNSYVKAAHPTTSSAKHDNDLMLTKNGKLVARIEVSDLVSARPNPAKLRKDLKSLLTKSKRRQERLFLATSKDSQFSSDIALQTVFEGSTKIIEIKR